MAIKPSLWDLKAHGPPPVSAGYGMWTEYRVPHVRTSWHARVRQFYEYGARIAPPGRWAGRPQIVIEDMVPLL